MQRFADLLDRLILTPSRNGKLRLMEDYFRAVPDPERGWAVAAITRDLDIRSVKPAMLREMTAERVDAELFALSYDYVGDLGETISLIWPGKRGANYQVSLTEVVETLNAMSRTEARGTVATWLDALDPTARWALIKLITGGLRIGVGARLVKQALANFGGKPIQDIEELWHGLAPPYTALFQWLEGKADKPENAMKAPFRPVMLAHAIEEADKPRIDLSENAFEWKWDGIRVQAVAEGGQTRLYSRTGDDISNAFPDLVESMEFDAAIDGELLVYDPAEPPFAVRPFNDLQQRLNRKTVTKAMLADYPAFIRAYDLLWHDGQDLRGLPFEERRALLERFIDTEKPARFDLSPTVSVKSWEHLAELRANPPLDAIEGLMLKKRSSVYVPGRPRGEWWKWKRQPFLIDAVLMYAQRGHGKRSSYYSDYTFGCWRQDENGTDELVPVGKAYHGFTDEELKRIDRYVRNNTIDRFGPVRSVRASKEEGLVLEIAFEGLARSKRHKSGVSMRFPRISRLRWDKPAADADRLETLEAMIPD
ncbi:cisplatin damage response ATP-dependent DNA ligase [Aquisalinus flavus]|uniref:DNA ligase (ATP) n=1 Tax=Aquisalinus flavus TaxID=1526572 RepID=A0A8J2V441_9PROT|nr:cisplatin damage response ATP-dependent DNA ligase [Aquisalinus flavus]MBD0427241.1 cisplatin damage response ATP-dependent DNA ligase [Aquisalinus flavus]UNE47055.1 cisplatin damage response ATP-dependent DNA ligase [Aquisalinus flavus]GGC99441.1 ATP-dependent DNA ligase [Aquisalinus flavus]